MNSHFQYSDKKTIWKKAKAIQKILVMVMIYDSLNSDARVVASHCSITEEEKSNFGYAMPLGRTLMLWDSKTCFTFTKPLISLGFGIR